MSKKKQAAEPGYNVFICQLCPDHPQFDAGNQAFSTHMTEVHQFDMKAKYNKVTLRHVDATDWYEWQYAWKNGDMTFAVQAVRNPRSPDDAMYWSDE